MPDEPLKCKDKLIWNSDSDIKGDWAFSFPVHAIESPEDIDAKVIKPIKALLDGKQPDELDSELFEDVLKFEGKGINIRLANKR